MLTQQTQYKLALLFKAIAEGEKQVEVTRQVLAEKAAFEPYSAFKRIDRGSNSYITALDLVDFLRENSVSVLERDIRDLFKQYDTKRDDRACYTEFLNMLLPKDNSKLRQICTQRESYNVSKTETLPYEVEHALSRVLEAEIDYTNRIEALKKDLADRDDYEALHLFRAIDIRRLGAVDYNMLCAFFKANEIALVEAEIVSLLRRVDKDHDGKLTFSEFYTAITVLNPYGRAPSPSQKSARARSPQRNATSMTNLVHMKKTSEKLANYDYIDYVQTSSTQKSVRTRSPPPTVKKAQDNSEPAYDELSTAYRYKTPTKPVATPMQGKSLIGEDLYRSGSPSRMTSGYMSPMKGDEEQELARALREQIEMDKALEDVKVDLSLRRDFNLLDVFRFFDAEEEGAVSKREFKQALNDLGVAATNDEVYLVMKKFDTNNDGLLKFADFVEMFTPKEGSYAEILNKRSPFYAGAALDEAFDAETMILLKKILQLLVKNEASSESIRQRLNRRPLFNLWEGFKALDRNGNGFVSAYEFKDMLIEHGFFPSQKEVTRLVQRYDKNHDGKVSYGEFIQEITPKSPKKY